MSTALVSLFGLTIPVALGYGFSALMRRVYGVRFLAALRWGFTARHLEIVLPLLLFMLIWMVFSWALIYQSISGLFAQGKGVVVMGKTPGGLYALDVSDPRAGVSFFEGLGGPAPGSAGVPRDSLERLFTPLALWRSPLTSGYGNAAIMHPLVTLFFCALSIGTLTVSFAVGGILMAGAHAGRLAGEGAAFAAVSQSFRQALGFGLGRVVAGAASVFVLLWAINGIGYLSVHRDMPLARGQAEGLRAEYLQRLSPGTEVTGTIAAREYFRPEGPAGVPRDLTAPPPDVLACYHVRLPGVPGSPVYLGYYVVDAPGVERDRLEAALRTGSPLEFTVTPDQGIARE